MKLVIMDSGVQTEESIEGIHFFYENNKIESDDNIIDNVGHGTAIYNIISGHNCKLDFFIVKRY